MGDYPHLTCPMGDYSYLTCPVGDYPYHTCPMGDYPYHTCPVGDYPHHTCPMGDYLMTVTMTRQTFKNKRWDNTKDTQLTSSDCPISLMTSLPTMHCPNSFYSHPPPQIISVVSVPNIQKCRNNRLWIKYICATKSDIKMTKFHILKSIREETRNVDKPFMSKPNFFFSQSEFN